MVNFHSTTIVAVKTADGIAMAGDGQVTMGETTIMKGTARKVRRLYNDSVVAGFAGSVADAFILFDKFENHLDQCHGQLSRAAVELAKEWRNEKAARNLEALLLLADKYDLFLVSGNGEVIVPDEGIAAGILRWLLQERLNKIQIYRQLILLEKLWKLQQVFVYIRTIILLWKKLKER